MYSSCCLQDCTFVFVFVFITAAAPVLEVVEAGVIGGLKDHVHPAEPRTVHLLH